MQAQLKDQQPLQPQYSCPKLGLVNDPATFSAFPSQMNACSHVQPITTPNIAHQRSFCLNSEHINCPVFQSQPGGKMPKALTLQTRGIAKSTLRLIMAVLALIVTIIIVVWFFLNKPILTGEFSPSEPDPDLLAVATTPVTITEETATSEPSPSDLPATKTQPPSTPTQEDPTLALDIPIGDEVQFIIHRVAEGETLQIFANQYDTTVEAITAINYDLIVPLWTNWLVIIPLNNTDVDKLPVFEAHQVEQEHIPLADIAAQLSASVTEMQLYNNLDADHILHQGEWLLVPRERP